MSRDREGAVSLHRRYKHRHRISLLVRHVSNCRFNVVPMEQPPRTSVPCPSFPIGAVHADLVQSPACVRLKVVHHLFRFRFGLDDNVNMSGPHVRRQERPLSVQRDFPDYIQHHSPAGPIQQIRILIHQIPFASHQRRVGFKSAMSRNVVVPVHRTGFITVQVRSIAAERNQVGHTPLSRSNSEPRASASGGPVFSAPSRSRLGGVGSRSVILCKTTKILSTCSPR